MIELRDKDKNRVAGLVDYENLCIESVLESGDKTLSFYYPKKGKYYDEIVEEAYIRTKKDEFVVKARELDEDYTKFECSLNLEELEGNIFDRFESVEQTITSALNLAVVGTGWTVKDNTLKKMRTVRCTNKSSLEIVREIKKVYRVDIVFNTLGKQIEVYEHLGEDKGTYFIDSLNLIALQVQSDSRQYATRIIAEGKDGLSFSDINNGKNYVENYQYSNKVKTIYWKDERYSVKENLLEDARAKLEELSKPFRSYSASILNIAELNPRYSSILDFKLGDAINLISKKNKIRDKQRIVKTIEWPQDHTKDSVELANATLKFEDIQQENQETTDTVNNITTDNGTVDGSTIDSITTKQIEDFEANVIKVAKLKAILAEIENLHVNKADIQNLNAVIARIGTLEATKASITELNAIHAIIQQIKAGKADITDLNAAVAKVGILENKTAVLENALAGNLTADNFKTNAITAGSAVIAEGAIGSSQISSLSVNKLEAGDITTSKHRIVSADGTIEIVGNQILINRNNVNRVILGEYRKSDGTTEYGLLVRAKDGQTIMLDGNGVHNAGITDGAIDNNKVADNANISGNKLDINSVIREVNNNGTETIAGTRIQVGDRTLDIELSTQKNTITEHSKELSSQKASLTALDNALKFKVDSQTFTQSTETINSNINRAKEEAIKAAENLALEKSNLAKKYADEVATAKANLAKTEAIANADGKISAEEQKRIQQAQENLNTAISKADKAKQDAILEANRVAELKKQEAINSANSHADSIAASKANEALNNAKAYTNTEITTVNTHLNKATSEINVLKGQISSKVSQSDVDNTVIKYKTQNYGYLYKKDIIIHGDYNFYYPVIIKRGNQDVKRKIFINRSFNEQAPSEWNPDLATHHGGLSLLISANFGGWGGANYSWNIYDLEEQYSRMFAGAVNCASNMAFAIFLRGGGEKGAVYHLYSDQPLDGELPLKEGMPKPSVPQIAYNKEMIGFYEPAYEFYAPGPRTITKEVEEEIKRKKFIELAQSNTNEIIETNKKITTVESTLTQENNSIKASVRDLNSTTQSITTNVSNINRDLTSKINSNLDAAKSFATDIAIAKADKAKQDAINTASSDATNKANNALNSAKAYTNAEITTINSKVHNVESNLNILSDRINSKVSQSDVDKSISNIIIGGRNLFLDSDLQVCTKSKNWFDNFKSLVTTENNLNYATMRGTQWFFGQYVELEEGQTYTASCLARVNKASQLKSFLLHIKLDAIANVDYVINKACTDNFQRISYTFVWSRANARERIHFLLRDSSAIVDIALIKLEKGNKATDWSPAPEDVNTLVTDSIKIVDSKISDVSSNVTQLRDSVTTQINSINSKTHSIETTLGGKASKQEVTEVNNRVATIKASLDGITQRVSATESKTQTLESDLNDKASKQEVNNVSSKVVSLEANLNGITNRVSSTETVTKSLNDKLWETTNKLNNVEQRITPTSIINMVSSSYYQKGEANNLFSTKSEVEQLDNRVNYRFSNTGYSNLIFNGNFANGTVHWRNWGNCSLVAENGQLTVRAKQSSNNANIGAVSSTFVLEKGKKYSLTFQGCSSWNIPWLNYIYLLGEDGVNHRLDLRIDINSADLVYRTATFTAPATKWVRLLIGVEGYLQTDISGFKLVDVCLVEGDIPRRFIPNANEISEGATSIDSNGVIVRFTDDSYVSMTHGGFAWKTKNMEKAYHCLAETGWVNISTGAWLGDHYDIKITLPEYFRGKVFTPCSMIQGWYVESNFSLNQLVVNIPYETINYSEGSFVIRVKALTRDGVFQRNINISWLAIA